MKKIFIYGLVFILISSFVFADCSDVQSTVIAFYECENNFNDSSANNYNIETSDYSNTFNSGIYKNGAYSCDFELDNSQYAEANVLDSVLVSEDAHSFCMWVKMETTGGATYGLIFNGNVAGDWTALTNHDTNERFNAGAWDGATIDEEYDPTDRTGDTDWHYVCATIADDGDATVYVDGTQTDNSHNTPSVSISEDVFIGRRNTAYTDAQMDDILIVQKELTLQEMDDLKNGTCSPVAVASEPSLTINSNLTDTFNFNQQNFNIAYNGTISDYTGLFNCSLYNLSNKINQSLEINLSNNNYFHVPLTNYGTMNLSINCTGSSNINDTYGPNYLLYDLIIPEIELDISTTFTNNSQYYDDTTITANFLIQDANLYAVNGSIKDSNTNSLENNLFYENIITSSFQLNLSNSTSNLGIGNHTITVTAWDSHTDNYVRDIDVFYGINLIKADDISFYAEDFKLFDKDNNPITYFYLSKDRYKFKITFESPGYYHTLVLTTPETLVYLPESGYKGHFVYLPGKRWIDFEGTNVKNVLVTRLDNNMYEVQVELYEISDEVEFESIGDLNEITKSWYFSIVAAPGLDEEYYPLFLTELQGINNNTEKIYGVIEMLSLIILWLGLWIFGYYAIQTNNNLLGGTMIVLTLPIDIYFAYVFRETLHVGTGFIGVAFSFMTAWSLGVFLLIKRKRKSDNLIQQ